MPNKEYTPTTTAPGNMVMIDDFGVVSGTTIASGFISGLIALMKEAQPNLSGQSITHILQAASENTQQSPREYVGNGYVNPIKAISLAKQE